MNTEIFYKLQKMDAYKNQFKNIFKWDNGSLKYVAAILCAIEEKDIDEERLDQMRQMILAGTKRFSVFRNSFLPLLSVLLAMNENPEELFADIKDIYAMLRDERFHDGALTVATAYYIAVCGEESEYQKIVQSCRLIYKQMRKNHPLLTGADDYLDVAMMAIKGFEADAAIERMEQIYTKLQEHFGKGNELQAIASAIVLLDDDDDSLCEKVISLDSELLNRSCKLRGEGTTASLAVLADIGHNDSQIADDLIELIDHMKTMEDYDEESVDDTMRQIIAIAFLIEQLLNNQVEEHTIKNRLIITKTLCYMVLFVSCSSTTLLL